VGAVLDEPEPVEAREIEYRERPVERRSDTVVLYARTVTPRRAVALGVLALEELWRRRPERVRIVMFGDEHPLPASFPYEFLGIVSPNELSWLMTDMERTRSKLSGAKGSGGAWGDRASSTGGERAVLAHARLGWWTSAPTQRPRCASGRNWRRSRPGPHPKSRTRFPSHDHSGPSRRSTSSRRARPDASKPSTESPT